MMRTFSAAQHISKKLAYLVYCSDSFFLLNAGTFWIIHVLSKGDLFWILEVDVEQQQ